MAQILLVDDEKSIRLTLGEFLRGDGYDVQTAEDAEGALALLKEDDFDVVVTDIILPRVTGVDLLKVIREAAPYVQVIMMTGEPTVETASESLRAGAFDYLFKPISKDAILKTVANSVKVKALDDERRRLEEENRRYQESLEELVEQRTQALRESEERYRTLIENSVEAIYMFDPETKQILEANPSFEQLLGYTAEEVSTLAVYDFVAHDRESIDTYIQRILTVGSSSIGERKWRKKDGSLIDVQVTASAIRQEGRDIGFVVVRDITEERQIQEHIHQQERLAAVGQLAAGIAHDFNNLLTGVIGFAQLLRHREDMPESAKAELKRIEDQGHRAAHLIRQILDFSRQSVTQRRPLDLVPFLKEVTKFLERAIPESIRIVLEMDAEKYLVDADLTQMQQVVTNLAINARDAMPEGGKLRLGLSRFTLGSGDYTPFPSMPPGKWVVLSFSDTGTGIAPEHLPHLFEPFFTTKGIGEGTGLGLAQVYGIVKQHNGFIVAKSQVGEGATFILYLPALNGVQEIPEEETPEEFPRGSRGDTVLVVEDEPVVLETIGMMLKQLGYRALMVGSGEKAIEVYDQHRDEVVMVLTDMVMPGMSGMTLARVLRAKDPDVKMVMMSGYPMEEAKELLSEEAVSWVQKPMGLDTLVRLVREVLT